MARVTYSLGFDYLHSILRYDPLTGILYWKKPGKRFGRVAGGKTRTGYISLSIDNNRYFAHRIAWMMYNGTIWDGVIDHINGDPADNRIANLRRVKDRVNHQNHRTHRAGKLVGASRHSRANKWQSRISVEGRTLHLGHFDTELEAHQAYMDAVEIVNKIERGEILEEEDE